MSSTSPSDGWCPFATRYSTTKYWSGNQGRRAVCLHIAQGSYEGAIAWLTDATSNPNSSAHFVIAKDGRIAQLVSIDDSAWANGLAWQNNQWYTGTTPVTPSWVDIVPGVNPNLYTISIEHEGVYTDTWTPEMYAANTRLLQWIAAQVGWTYTPHRNLIGHYEIDPITRANCPGPNVNYTQMAADANATDLLSQVVAQASTQHVYGTTALVTLPGYTIISQLTEVDIPVAGYLDYQGTRWYISQYSYQNQISSFFDSAASTPPVQDLIPGLSLNPGYRDAVTPSASELSALAPQWIRVLLFSQYQNTQTGQNTELDWLLSRIQGLGINVLVLVNTETVGQLPPATGSSAWPTYNATVSDLAAKIASYYGSKIGAIEIFNEPDVQNIAPADYGALLAACYPKVKAVSSLPVISAGICCGENHDYLRSMAAMARGFYDGTGWHAYAERIDGYPFATFGNGELRNSISFARAIGGKPVWITEIGALLDWNWGPNASPPDAVAAYLTRAYALMRSLGRNSVTQAFWFTWKISGENWGLVDDAGNHHPAWTAFQQATHPGVTPSGPPAITGITLSPSTVPSGQSLNVSITVKNNSNATLQTQGPDPGFAYTEGDTFATRGFASTANAFRVGIDFDGNTTGIDHPYRWGLGAPLAPGASMTVTGSIRLNALATKNYWGGLVQEQVAWLQDKQGTRAITVAPAVPVGTTPVITSVNLSPTTLNGGDLLTVTITVRNDSTATLATQGPSSGFVYNEGDDFKSRGFIEQSGAFRVGIDFDGRSGIDHPYRWGLGSPLGPGQTATVTGAIRLTSSQSRNYWAGLVREQVVWLQDHQGTEQITVNGGTMPPPPPPPPVTQPAITAVTFSPTSFPQGQLLQVSVTVTNNTAAALTSQGPNPGFIYNEGDNYLTKQNPSVNGAYRIGVDFDGRTGIDHPYRWGLGTTLASGQSVTVNGFIRLNRRQDTNFWVALILEGTGAIQDQQGKTLIHVSKS